MKFFAAIKNWFNWSRRSVQNRLESAAGNFTGARRWLFSAYQDARFEFDFSQTMEVCRKHLDLIENTPILQRIRNLKIQFSVGVDGLKVIPNASDPNLDKATVESWNEARAASWERWCKNPELGSNLSFAELTIQWEGMLFDVGNVIVHKTRDAAGRPKIQTIDRLRLQTPPDLADQEGKTILQGVQIDRFGKPTGYYIRDTFDLKTFRLIPANEIIHKFRAIRPGMVVGLPEAFSVINLVIDFTDLHILEMGASKLAGELATVETNAAGELDTTYARTSRLGIQSTNLAGNAATRNTLVDYNVTLGAKKYALKTGDKLENFMVNRPTIAQQDYWEFLLCQICAGYGVPRILVTEQSLQGTVTRAVLDIATNAFRSDFEIIASLAREVYEWQTEWAVKFDRTLDGKTPANYCTCVIKPPRSPNVDIGYNAKVVETELELGIKTVQDIYAEKNQDWRVETRQIAEYLAHVKGLAEEYGIEPGQITRLAVTSPLAAPKPLPAEPLDDDPAEPQPTDPAYAKK